MENIVSEQSENLELDVCLNSYQLLKLEALRMSIDYHRPAQNCTKEIIVDTAKVFIEFLTN
jgi:hypothetical protein